MKKLSILVSVLFLSVIVLSACAPKVDCSLPENICVAQVTDMGGVDDKSFNQSAWEGAQQALDEDLVATAKYLESQAQADRVEGPGGANQQGGQQGADGCQQAEKRLPAWMGARQRADPPLTRANGVFRQGVGLEEDAQGKLQGEPQRRGAPELQGSERCPGVASWNGEREPQRGDQAAQREGCQGEGQQRARGVPTGNGFLHVNACHAVDQCQAADQPAQQRGEHGSAQQGRQKKG